MCESPELNFVRPLHIEFGEPPKKFTIIAKCGTHWHQIDVTDAIAKEHKREAEANPV